MFLEYLLFITSAQIILATSSSFYMRDGRKVSTHFNTPALRFLSNYFVSSICLLVTGQILLFWVVPWVSFVWDSIEMRFLYPTSMQSCIWIYYYGILNSLFLAVCSVSIRPLCVLELVQNLMAHAQKPDFVFRLHGRVHLIGGGVSSVDCWQPRCAHQR